jgi:hypothetical protein
MISTLHSHLGPLVVGLARVAVAPPDARVVITHGDAFEVALCAVEAAVEASEDLAVSARRLYLAAILLANTLDRFEYRSARTQTLRATAARVLAMFEDRVSDVELEIAERLVGEPIEPPVRALVHA